MKPLRIKDVIGPIMVGPSSSHTAGALRIASMAQKLFQRPIAHVEFILYGSFAHTYRGHGTDRALVGGILGYGTDDLNIRHSLEIARQAGINVVFTQNFQKDHGHPNTVDVILTDPQGSRMQIRGMSIGGGGAILSQIDGIDVSITGEHNSLVIIQHDEKGVLAHIATCISKHDINIATTRMYRENRGERAYTIIETDEALTEDLRQDICRHPAVSEVRIIPADGTGETESAGDSVGVDESGFERFDFPHAQAVLDYCETNGCGIAEAFLARERALAATSGKLPHTEDYLTEVLAVMEESARRPLIEVNRSMGGLIGGEARKLKEAEEGGRGICGPELSKLIRYALAVSETNASMGRIVAAPTAGSSGVLPAVLFTLQESKGFSDEELIRGLVVAGAVGYLIARNATVSGAEGGCQAEMGSAAAMAAAAAVDLAGGTPQQCFAAASNALTNMMGLVCDPIGGLVEIPCQKRNASGAATAFVSAEIALAGVENLVDFDETVDALYRVGRALPFELRESALGGIAVAPSACAYCAGC